MISDTTTRYGSCVSSYMLMLMLMLIDMIIDMSGSSSIYMMTSTSTSTPPISTSTSITTTSSLLYFVGVPAVFSSLTLDIKNRCLILFRLDSIMAFASPWYRDEADAPFSLWRRRLFDDEFVPRTAASIATTISAKKESMLSHFIVAVMLLWCDANGKYESICLMIRPILNWGWMDDD